MPFDALRSPFSSAVSPSPGALDSSAPVGIFDSGLGGLSVLRAVRGAVLDVAFDAGRLPARTCIGVTALARGARVEIDFVARRSIDRQDG